MELEYYEFLKNICSNAGEIIKKGFHSKINVKEKGVKDFVTNIDLAVEKKLIEEIKKEFPKHNILSEEAGLFDNSSDYKWIIDPLDGTTNFIHKIPIFAISIGLEYKNKSLAGIVYSPITDEIFYAEKEKGAYLNGNKLKIDTKKNVEDWFLAYCFHDSKKNSDAVKKIKNTFYKKCLRLTKFGSAAMELCYTASNRVDGYVAVGLKDWDFSAGKLIVEESGGIVKISKSGEDKLIIAGSIENTDKIEQMLINSEE